MKIEPVPTLGDRVVASVIALVFSAPFAWIIGGVWLKFGEPHPLGVWSVTLAFGVYGFVAPRRARDVLGEVWAGILGFFSSRRR